MPEERVQGDTEEDWTRLIDALERKRAISALMYLGCKGRVKEVTIRDDIFPIRSRPRSSWAISRMSDWSIWRGMRSKAPGVPRSSGR